MTSMPTRAQSAQHLKVQPPHTPSQSPESDVPSADGAVGEKAQKVGGPFDKEGAVGKQFKQDGSIGGTAQSAAETAQGEKPSAFDAEGMIGKQFTSQYAETRFTAGY